MVHTIQCGLGQELGQSTNSSVTCISCLGSTISDGSGCQQCPREPSAHRPTPAHRPSVLATPFVCAR